MSIIKITNKDIVKIVKEQEKTLVKKSNKNTVATRKEKLRESIDKVDVDALVKIQEEMDSFVNKMNLVHTKNDLDVLLVDDDSLMDEIITLKNIQEFLDVRRDMIKEIVFEKINNKIRVEDPDNDDVENTNGFIEVDELGKKFCREGAGRGEPTLDIDKIKEVFGDDALEFVKQEIIPEQRKEVIDEDLFVGFLAKNPDAITKVSEAIVPGKLRSPRFVVRDI